jgi:hypothetical protein
MFRSNKQAGLGNSKKTPSTSSPDVLSGDVSVLSISTTGSTGGASEGGKDRAMNKKAPSAPSGAQPDASIHLLYLGMSNNSTKATSASASVASALVTSGPTKERAMSKMEITEWVEKKISEQESIIDITDRKMKEAKVLLKARSGNQTTWIVTASQILNMEAKLLHAANAIEQLDELVLEIATGGSEVQYFKDKAEDILNAPVTRYSFQDKELILKECELKGYGWKDPSGKMLSV